MGLNMINKYDNTVIFSLSNEHCERIVKWWNKELGSCYGVIAKGKYIGLIDGWFNAYTLDQVQKASATIIELPNENLREQDWKTFTKDINTKIIDLTNVEGVEMMVSENNRFWVIKKIIYKYKYSYVDEDMFHWKYAKPIEPIKKETIEEVAERLFPNAEKIGGETYTAYKGFIEGAKFQAERMYSQAVNFAEWIRIKDFQTANKDNWIGLDMKYYTTKELFEQFKQKSNEQFKNK